MKEQLLKKISQILENTKFEETAPTLSEEERYLLCMNLVVKIQAMRENLLRLRRIDTKKADRQQDIIWANRLKLIYLRNQDIDEPYPGANNELLKKQREKTKRSFDKNVGKSMEGNSRNCSKE